MKKVLITTIFIISSILILPFYSNAQISQSPIDGVTISAEPSSPSPNEEVTVSIESYVVDLNSASIVWLINNKTSAHGVGMKEFKVKAPKIGESIVVTAAINTSDDKEIKKAYIIKSGSVEIIWESEGYLPPFYKGRNIFAYQNTVKLIAIPHLSSDGKTESNPKNLVYKWKKGGKYIDNGTGYGVQSIKIKSDDIPKPMEISVDVYTRDQNESAQGFISLEPTNPTIEFYEIDPLYGILFNKSIGSKINLNNSEITVLSAPFGFNKDLSYTWSVNNVERPDLSKNQSITLRTKGDTDGSSDIGLDIRGLDDILQGAQSSFSINFKKKINEIEESVKF